MDKNYLNKNAISLLSIPLFAVVFNKISSKNGALKGIFLGCSFVLIRYSLFGGYDLGIGGTKWNWNELLGVENANKNTSVKVKSIK